MSRFLGVVADIVVRTDLGGGRHELGRKHAPVCRDAGFASFIVARMLFSVEEQRLSSLGELIDRGLRGIRDVSIGIAFQLGITGCLACVERIDRRILTALVGL